MLFSNETYIDDSCRGTNNLQRSTKLDKINQELCHTYSLMCKIHCNCDLIDMMTNLYRKIDLEHSHTCQSLIYLDSYKLCQTDNKLNLAVDHIHYYFDMSAGYNSVELNIFDWKVTNRLAPDMNKCDSYISNRYLCHIHNPKNMSCYKVSWTHKHHHSNKYRLNIHKCKQKYLLIMDIANHFQLEDNIVKHQDHNSMMLPHYTANGKCHK